MKDEDDIIYMYLFLNVSYKSIHKINKQYKLNELKLFLKCFKVKRLYGYLIN